MTEKELNRDMAKLIKRIKEYEDAGRHELLPEIRTEFERLYHADDTLESFSKKHILAIVKLVYRYQFIPLHRLAIKIKF